MIFTNWYRLQNHAKDHGYDSLEFHLMTGNGLRKCKWLDAYMGLFTIEGEDGFLLVRDADQHIPDPVILVEDESEKVGA